MVSVVYVLVGFAGNYKEDRLRMTVCPYDVELLKVYINSYINKLEVYRVDSYLYYCKVCNILDKSDYGNKIISCSQCGNDLFPMNVTEHEWMSISDDEKREVLKRAVMRGIKEEKKMVVPKNIVPEWNDEFECMDEDVSTFTQDERHEFQNIRNNQSRGFDYRDREKQSSDDKYARSTVNKNTKYNNKKRKNLEGKVSGMSIGAFVCSLTIFLSFIGLILGIIDLTKKDNRKKGFSIAAVIISSIFLIINLALSGSTDSNEKYSENVAVVSDEAQEITDESASTDVQVEETNINIEKQDISNELPSEYVYITPADLQMYCANLVGQKIYTVGEIADIKGSKVQINLADGLMMSNFVTDINYEEVLERNTIVAVYGEVEGYNSYSFMGTSADVKDCVVFATGDRAKAYEKPNSDETLKQFFVMTEEVAKSNNEDISKDDYIALCEKLGYNDIMRNPDSFKGKYCAVNGRVSQVIEGFLGGYTIFIEDANGNIWGCTYRYAEGESHILEGDSVTVYGECGGTQNTTTVLGKQVSMPVVSVKYVK